MSDSVRTYKTDTVLVVFDSERSIATAYSDDPEKIRAVLLQLMVDQEIVEINTLIIHDSRFPDLPTLLRRAYVFTFIHRDEEKSSAKPKKRFAELANEMNGC
jgi:hypothetical protein